MEGGRRGEGSPGGEGGEGGEALISGIIVTFEPLGREAACIEAFTSHFEHKCACLIDDNADILEEVSQNPKALGVHIKLSKKRRLRSDFNFHWGTVWNWNTRP